MKINKEFKNAELVHSIESMEEEELARLLKVKTLGSYLDAHPEDKEWEKLGIREISEEWNNEADSLYDNWREHYGIPKG